METHYCNLQLIISTGRQRNELDYDYDEPDVDGDIDYGIDNDDEGEYREDTVDSSKRKAESKNYARRSSYEDTYDNDSEAEEEDEDEDDDDNFEFEFDEQPGKWEWETYRKSTHIYLPPPRPVEMPKTIIHFIGGTLFGSYPLQFYKPLLERIAMESNSIIVATSVPVTLSKNPLNHYLLSKNIASEFSRAYRNIIVDEYGEEVAATMKIVGLGHSLGSRLQMIISTSKKLKRIGYERDGNILIAFNNYNAVESVPGVKRLERGIQDTLYGDVSRGDGRARGRDGRDVRSDAYYDEYEIGLSDVVNAVSEGIQDQVSTIKTAFTPDLDKQSLEFQPSPQQLWDGVEKEYDVGKTLVVQFDQDFIDQSSRLAKAIMDSEGFSITNGTDGVGADISLDVIEGDGYIMINGTADAKDANIGTDINIDSDSKGATGNNTTEPLLKKDIKFARLRGTHLTPVSYSQTFIAQAMKRAGGALGQDQILQEAIQEENEYRPSSKKRRTRVKKQDIDHLSASIARYVTDIIVGIDCDEEIVAE